LESESIFQKTEEAKQGESRVMLLENKRLNCALRE